MATTNKWMPAILVNQTILLAVLVGVLTGKSCTSCDNHDDSQATDTVAQVSVNIDNRADNHSKNKNTVIINERGVVNYYDGKCGAGTKKPQPVVKRDTVRKQVVVYDTVRAKKPQPVVKPDTVRTQKPQPVVKRDTVRQSVIVPDTVHRQVIVNDTVRAPVKNTTRKFNGAVATSTKIFAVRNGEVVVIRDGYSR